MRIIQKAVPIDNVQIENIKGLCEVIMLVILDLNDVGGNLVCTAVASFTAKGMNRLSLNRSVSFEMVMDRFHWGRCERSISSSNSCVFDEGESEEGTSWPRS